jgi:hypothetical protein
MGMGEPRRWFFSHPAEQQPFKPISTIFLEKLLFVPGSINSDGFDGKLFNNLLYNIEGKLHF